MDMLHYLYMCVCVIYKCIEISTEILIIKTSSNSFSYTVEEIVALHEQLSDEDEFKDFDVCTSPRSEENNII